MAAYNNATASNQSFGSSKTFSHTVSGTNRYLIVGVMDTNKVGISSVTYNSVAMTSLGSLTSGNAYPGITATITLYGLVAPSTGANNVVITLASIANCSAVAASYTGIDQVVSVVGSTTADFGAIQAVNTILTNTVSTTNTSWLVGICAGFSFSISAGSSTTKRVEANNGSSNFLGIFDSNADIPTGSSSIRMTNTGGIDWLFSVTVAISNPRVGGASNLMMLL
jgi:hypothetical protein